MSAASGGEPIRCVVRMARSELGLADATEGGSVFIAGNALELVPPHKAEGTRHTLSRIFDAHASDHDVWAIEAKPLIASLVAGENVSMVLAGHMRSGRDALFGAVASLSMEEVFEAMHMRQKAVQNAADAMPGGGGGLDFTVVARYVAIMPGDPQAMTDLTAAGSSSVQCVSDPHNACGFVLRGAEPRVIGSAAEMGQSLKLARSRLRASRPPAPSSALIVELRQGRKGARYPKGGPGAAAPEGPADLISTLTVFDIEVGALGDALSNGLRQLLSSPASATAHFHGPSLLLRDCVGGNTRTLLVGTLRPADNPESEATLRLVAGGLAFSNFPLVNDRRTRGLLAHHRWVSSQLQEQLTVAEGRLQYGVDQLSADRQALPNQLHGATERLQAVVDQLQRDAAGKSGERERLLAEVLEMRAAFNTASGELVALKEELISEKREKVALSRELVEAQLSTNEEAAARAERMFALENEAIAASDMLEQLQAKAAAADAELERAREALAKASQQGEASALQAAELSVQARSLRAEAVEAREREDELALELLNQTNATNAAQARAQDAETRLAALTVEAEAQRGRAETSASAAAQARAEALGLAEEVAALKVGIERQALALQRDRLALQRSAVDTAEEQLSRVAEAEARADAVSWAKREAERERDDGAARASAELGERREVEVALRARLDEHAAQVEALQRHVELLHKADTGVPEAERQAAVDAVRKLKLKELKAALAERGMPDKGKKEELTVALEAAVLADLEAAAAERAAAEAASRGVDPSEALKGELVAYQRQLNAALEANRGLVEAYWRIRTVAGEDSLPSHAELLGAACVDGATGRRAVMSELEKSLTRDKDKLTAQLQAAHAQLVAAEETAPAAAAAEVRAAELPRSVAEAVPEEDEKTMLRRLVNDKQSDELETERLRKAVAALEADKAELAARLDEAEVRAAPPFATKPGEYEAALAERNAQLRELKWKVAEHTQSEAALERERTEMKRRACAAEDQLAELQRYLSTNIARYQKEILRLRDLLKAKGVSAAGEKLHGVGSGVRGETGALRGEAGLLPREGGLLPGQRGVLAPTGA